MGQLEAQLKTTVHLAGLNDVFHPLFRSSIPTCSVRSNPFNMYSVITHLVVLNGVLLRWKLGWSLYNLWIVQRPIGKTALQRHSRYTVSASRCAVCAWYTFFFFYCLLPLKFLLCETFFGQCPFFQSLLCWYSTPSYSTPLSFLSLSLGETEFCRWCKGPAQQGRCVMMMILIIIIILWCHRRGIPEPGVLNQALWRMREEREGRYF